jgi:hypothetical protein
MCIKEIERDTNTTAVSIQKTTAQQASSKQKYLTYDATQHIKILAQRKKKKGHKHNSIQYKEQLNK